MRQFVRQQSATLARVWLVAPAVEGDVRPRRVGQRSHGPRGIPRPLIRINPHLAEVVSKARLKKCPRFLIKWPAAKRQPLTGVQSPRVARTSLAHIGIRPLEHLGRNSIRLGLQRIVDRPNRQLRLNPARSAQPVPKSAFDQTRACQRRALRRRRALRLSRSSHPGKHVKIVGCIPHQRLIAAQGYSSNNHRENSPAGPGAR